MTLNIHVATLGHDMKTDTANKGPIIEAIQKYPSIAKLYLLCSHESDVAETKKDLAIFRTLVIEGRKIYPFDFSDIIGTIVEINRMERRLNPDARFFINVTGGTKVMSCAALVGANYIGATAYYVKGEDGQSIELSPPKIPPESLTELQQKIVKLLDGFEEGMMQTKIGQELGTNAQKINYNCKSLQRSGYLEIGSDKDDGRATRIRLTPMGKMALRAL